MSEQTGEQVDPEATLPFPSSPEDQERARESLKQQAMLDAAARQSGIPGERYATRLDTPASESPDMITGVPGADEPESHAT